MDDVVSDPPIIKNAHNDNPLFMYLADNNELVPYVEIGAGPQEDFCNVGWQSIPVARLSAGRCSGEGQSGGALFRHQQATVVAALQHERTGLLIYHSTGTGKTEITLFTVVRILLDDPQMKALITAPAKSLSGMWTEKLSALPSSLEGVVTPEKYLHLMKRVTLVSHESLKTENGNVNGYSHGVPSTLDTEKPFVIFIDEGHRFRLSSLRHIAKTTQSAVEIAGKAKKVFILSATPVFNDPFEAATLYAMLIGQTKTNKILGIGKCFTKVVRDGDIGRLTRMWRCLVSYHEIDFTVKTLKFPLLIEHPPVIRVMDEDEYSAYRKVQDNRFRVQDDVVINDHAFYQGLAKMNNVPSKIKWAVDTISGKLRAQPDVKIVVYTRFPESAFQKLKQMLLSNRPGTLVGEITGTTSEQNTRKMLSDFNKSQGGTSVLLLSKAGGSSLNLLGVRYVIILEPHFNDAWIRQVIGRAIRTDSHAHIPKEDERRVEVYHLLYDTPRGKKSADRLIYEMARKKLVLIKQFYKGLADAALERNLCLGADAHVVPRWVSYQKDRSDSPLKKRVSTKEKNTDQRLQSGDGEAAELHDLLSEDETLSIIRNGTVVDDYGGDDVEEVTVLRKRHSSAAEAVARKKSNAEMSTGYLDKYSPKAVLRAMDDWLAADVQQPSNQRVEKESGPRARTTSPDKYSPKVVLKAMDEWLAE